MPPITKRLSVDGPDVEGLYTLMTARGSVAVQRAGAICEYCRLTRAEADALIIALARPDRIEDAFRLMGVVRATTDDQRRSVLTPPQSEADALIAALWPTGEATGDTSALIVKWRKLSVLNHQRGNNQGHARESQAYSYGAEHAFDQCADELEALPALSPWRDIASAPKDGTPIIGSYDDGGGSDIFTWDAQNYHKKPRPYWQRPFYPAYLDRSQQPTLWMPVPLPAPPSPEPARSPRETQQQHLDETFGGKEGER